MLERRLALAEKLVAQAKNHIAGQQAAIERLERTGADTTIANDLLDMMRQALAGHERERDYIVALLKK